MPEPSLRDVVVNAPWWVWPILLMIVALGIRGTRRRRLNPMALVALPATFAAVSLGLLLGRQSGHGETIAWWLAGFIAGAGLGWWNAAGAEVWREKDGVSVPGAWSILVVPLVFFALQFWFGFLRATDPARLTIPPLSIVAPFAGALMTGFFAGRAGALFRLWRQAKARAN